MLKLTHIYKELGEKQVLQDINLILYNGVVALIGENGIGKTTLFKLLSDEIKPDSGNIEIHGEIGYVRQQPSFKETIGDSFDVNIEQWRIDIAMQNVGLDKPMNFKTDLLSGGQKTKLGIAIELAKDPAPNILLLDEPTNNLDPEALNWLEQFVKNFDGLIILVSHNRDFINKTCSQVLELEGGSIRTFSGNYDSYHEQKEHEYERELGEYQKRDKEKKKIETLIQSKSHHMQSVTNEKFDKIKHESKKRFNNSKNSMQVSAGKQLKALASRMEHLGQAKKPHIVKSYKIKLDGLVQNNKLIMRMDKIDVPYLPNLKNFQLEIRGNERVLIEGKNGTGKTTLLKIAKSYIKQKNDTVKLGSNISIGYLSQEVDGIDYNETALENLEDTQANETDIFGEARALGLNSNDLKKKPDELSRGQQAKLSFAKLLLAEHNLLILDEPTNHMDIPTKEKIEKALENYQGAILLASHDKYFVEKIGVTKVIKLS